MQNNKKQFVAPQLNEEKDLSTLTLVPATSNDGGCTSYCA